jgi:hypothetical protein
MFEKSEHISQNIYDLLRFQIVEEEAIIDHDGLRLAEKYLKQKTFVLPPFLNKKIEKNIGRSIKYAGSGASFSVGSNIFLNFIFQGSL